MFVSVEITHGVTKTLPDGEPPSYCGFSKRVRFCSSLEETGFRFIYEREIEGDNVCCDTHR